MSVTTSVIIVHERPTPEFTFGAIPPSAFFIRNGELYRKINLNSTLINKEYPISEYNAIVQATGYMVLIPDTAVVTPITSVVKIQIT